MYTFEKDNEIYDFVEKMLQSKDGDISWVIEKSEGISQIKKEYRGFFEFLYQRGFIFRHSTEGNYMLNRKGLEFFYKYKGATQQELNLIESQELAKNSLKIAKISLICSLIFGLVTIVPIIIGLLK